MTMTAVEVDRSLSDWKLRLQRIDENLVALETNPTCTLLEQAAESGLEGATRARVAPALSAMRELFAQRSLLDDVLSRATELRKARLRGDTLREIERLLRGPSIALPPVETPLARRGLLDAAETTSSISADQLLAAMVGSFDQARDAVSAVDEAWNRLTPEIERAAAEAQRLQTLAAGLGEDATGPLAAIRAQLEAVRAKIARDPLGAADSLAREVAARLQQLGGQLSSLEARHAQVCADLARARSLLAEIRSTHLRAAQTYRRCTQEIAADDTAAPRPALVDEGRVDGLEQWLTTLDATFREGRWSSAGVGVTRWLAAAQELLADEEAVERTSSAPLDHRDELLGRLQARRQQARTLASRGRRIDPALEEVASRAEAMLRGRPVRLAEADRAVADYEAALRAAP